MNKGADTYLAVMALRRNGITLTKAKKSIDSALTGKPVEIIAPKVESPEELMDELSGHGIRADLVTRLSHAKRHFQIETPSPGF